MTKYTWEEIIKQVGLDSQLESNVGVPHVPDEKVHLFHALDGGTTEFEWLNLIRSFVVAMKSELCLELGTFLGYGALSIASGLDYNGCGKLIAVDNDSGAIEKATNLLNRFNVSDKTSFICDDASRFIDNYKGQQFDLVFIDSGGGRYTEYQQLLKLNLLKKGGVVIIHDMSVLRSGPTPNTPWRIDFENNTDVFVLPLSRGLGIIFNK